jgi:hypothetical protein
LKAFIVPLPLLLLHLPLLLLRNLLSRTGSIVVVPV